MGTIQIIAAKPRNRLLGDNATLLANQVRVAAYCRVSTDNVEQQTSYDNQIEEWTKRFAIDVEQRLATMENILSKRKITPAMITPEIMDAFIYRVIIAGKHEIYFLIDINHNYSLKEVKQLRRKIVEMKPIYSNKVELARRFRDEHLTYKVIAI